MKQTLNKTATLNPGAGALQKPFALKSESPVPLYRQLAEQLRQRIRQNHLAPGTRLPDIKTLANLASVSILTVNSALNELILDRTCIRRPKRGTYVAAPGQKQKADDRKKICILYYSASIPSLGQDAIRFQLLTGIQQGCAKLQISLLFVTGDPIEMIEFYREDRRLEVLGVFLLDSGTYEEGINIARVFPDMRVVFFNDIQDGIEETPKNFYGVFHDDFAGGYVVGKALAARKPEHIGVLTIRQNSWVFQRRMDGFQLALRESGYNPASEVNVKEMKSGHFSIGEVQQKGCHLAQELFAEHPETDAIFATNDFLAAGARDALDDRKPDHNVLLFGYDNIFPEVSLKGKFSTVSIDFVRMGRRGIEVICATYDLPKMIYLAPQLIPRT